jgi:hypothetical protein
MLRETSDPVIIKGSTDIASISSPNGGLGRDGRERGPLDDVREITLVVTFIALLSFRRIKKVATNKMMRIATAPPIIPPISGLVSPLEGALLASVLEIAVAGKAILGTTPDGAEDEVAAAVGADGVAAVTTVLVTVCGWELASVVVKVSVMVKVVIDVA